MAVSKTINFLPDIFRSDANKKFLDSTFDQLTADSKNAPVYGYIGRTFSPTYRAGDNYLPEFTLARSRYQLEPGVVVKDNANKTSFTSSYIDLLQGVSNASGFSNANHNRLFSSESYSYNGQFDYDKFVNYYNYYWLPNGPDAVGVYANQTPYQATYTVTRNLAENGFTFTGTGPHANTQLTLARGGSYEFKINTPGLKFWIQTEPGVSGTESTLPTVTTRQVFGVQNNGTDAGTVRFNVPKADAQNFYLDLKLATGVDVGTTLKYTDIQNQLLSKFLEKFPTGIDGINSELRGKTFIFVNNDVDASYWTTPALPSAWAGLPSALTTGIAAGSVIPKEALPTTPLIARTSAWQITLVPAGADHIIQLKPIVAVESLQKVFVRSGKTFASNHFWLNNNFHYVQVPQITANKDYLFYQDSENPEFTGSIKIVDNKNTPINVDKDIVGAVGASINGVTFTNGLKIKFDSYVVPTSYANREFYVDGVGTSISLTPVDQLIVPESVGKYIETAPDYVTINRSSQDQNTWSRYNRWFHKDVIETTATYNNTLANFGSMIPASRPIIEFDPNIQLFNYGSGRLQIVDVIDFETNRDAFNQVEGQITAKVNNVTVTTGQKIIFAKDFDTNVKNKIWQVKVEKINGANFITLVDTGIVVSSGLNVLATSGNNLGIPYYYNGTDWITSQIKTTVNQPPLFDLFDADGYSFADTTVYPNSNFGGTRFFGYAEGTGKYDRVLTNLKLKYQNFNSIGDIVFDNYYDYGTFTFKNVSSDIETVNTKSGYLLKNNSLVTSWVKNKEVSHQYQTFTKFYEGLVLTDTNGKEHAFVQIDILPEIQKSIPYIKVYLNNKLLNPKTDLITTPDSSGKVITGIGWHGVYPVIQLVDLPEIGAKIDILIFSNTQSASGFYQVPENLDLNPLNETFPNITLGQLRTHYNKLIENTAGSKPIQDSYLRAQGGTLVQHSSPAIYAMSFLNHPTLNFVNSVGIARKEYGRFKNKFLSLCHSLTNIDYNNPSNGVDTILQNINSIKNINFSWYYSDMVPQGDNYTTINYTVLDVRQTNYEIVSIFNNSQLSNRAVLIYCNGTQLTYGVDYTFSKLTPSIVFTRVFNYGDKILIKDYTNTDGNYIPETPTKLGLYPKFVPEIYVDNTYQTPTTVIRGHDGSITPAFGDFRDQYLLELERRIYNNIKVDYNTNKIDLYSTLPGKFRKTDYSLDAFNRLLSKNFLQWSGQSNINYTTNKWYDVNNSWTWNYGGVKDIVTGAPLEGSWRAIYSNWFDTVTPNLTPWEMLGFSTMPLWWKGRYGSAPYTNGNTTLWQDLEAGYVWNNGDPYTDTRFVRPGLVKFIPVDSAGNLLNPTQIPVTNGSIGKLAGNDFKFGEQGPVEIAWRRSSDYPYAVQVALASARPADYFATQIDTSRFFKNAVTGFFTDVTNNTISTSLLVVNGDTTSGITKRSSGYLNWIADAIKSYGIDPVTTINEFIAGFNVNLIYKMSGFTDKNLISVTAEQTSPGATKASVIIPDENYDVFLNNSVPTTSVTYSAVIVEKTAGGYSVSGYDTANPFFTVIPNKTTGETIQVSSGDASVTIYTQAQRTPFTVPYGTTFTSIQQTANFLISYERYLIQQGFVFDEFDTDLAETRNWLLSVKEVLYWSQQGWGENTLIVLNPAATSLALNSQFTTVGEITNSQLGSRLLNQNFLPVKSNQFDITRTSSTTGNSTKIKTIDGSMLCFARLNLVQSEHVLVFDNITDFKDIIYFPSLGNRQYRLKLSGTKTGNWTGAVNATGYVYSNPTVVMWESGIDYSIGGIVTFNSLYYTAKDNVTASLKFDFSKWTLISAADLQQGLLPSLGHNAQKFNQFYDVDTPPDEEDLQLFSGGLIGFRKRPYLTNLGMSVPNQTKFYQGYTKQKGTINAINALTKANFDNVQSTITTHEEWAFRVGQYGDIDNNQYSEFVLDQSIFNTSPTVFNLTDNNSTGNIIVNLTNTSNLVYDTTQSTLTSLYQNRSGNEYHSDLPTTGYVNVQDVDVQIFDITKASPEAIVNIGRGHKIWTAKDSGGKWNVFRVNETGLIATSLEYQLDDLATLTFDNKHNFAEGDLFVLTQFITSFNDYNGLYEVIRVNNSTSVTVRITGPFTLLRYLISASPLLSHGIVYSLGSMVVDTVSEIESIKPQTDWVDNDTVWVNNAGDGNWGVYKFNQAWLSNAAVRVTANTVSTESQFGTSTRISSDSKYIYVGDPGSKHVQVFDAATNHANVTIANTYANFGQVVESQGNIIVVGSTNAIHIYKHDNGVVTPLQTNTFANVSSISLSANKQWLYVGGNNSVTAYHFNNNVYVQTNSVSNTGLFGNVVKTNNDGSTVFVSAPTADDIVTQNGLVYVYTSNTLTAHYTLHSQQKNTYSHFGTDLDIDATGGNLFIGIPGSIAGGWQNGLVERYVRSGNSYIYSERLLHPDNRAGEFGSTISVSADAKVLVVGGAGAPSQEATTFDDVETIIDAGLTVFIDDVVNAGAAYIFEPLIDRTLISTNGTYSYVQDLETQVVPGAKFGSAVDATRQIIVAGSKGSKSAHIFRNPTQTLVWSKIRSEQTKVDINNISRMFLYSKQDNNILAALDFVDPAKGKVLGTVSKDIDYQLTEDPALYNEGTGTLHKDLLWGPQQVGKIWWNLDTVRYVDYEQDELIYRLSRWGQQFVGSSIDVYQWIESTVLPSMYESSGRIGTPLYSDDSAYSTYGYVDSTGSIRVKYYYWVKGVDVVAPGKQNSVISISEAIENPQSQGVSYATVLSDKSIALHNITHLLSGTNTILHIGNRTVDAGQIHSEYALVQEGNPSSAIPLTILDKFVDSLAGIDRVGNTVPDNNLRNSQKYGIKIRPRQTMFANRELALKNYLDSVNPLLLSYPVVERKVLTMLNSAESAPNANSSEYNLTVDTVDELGYLDPSVLVVGTTRVLVATDSTHSNKWAIYTLTGATGGVGQFTLYRVQSYKTNLYWKFANWFDSNYDSTRAPDITVTTHLDLGKLTLVADKYIKVLDGGNNNFLVYYVDSNLQLNLVGIENGTIQLNTTAIPGLELRKILIAMQTEILIDDLASNYNKIFFSMIKYILTEQMNSDWVFKTSFLSAKQYIRKLQQFPSYIADNQDYYIDYINEVKPYRTVLREFVVDYVGNDTYDSDITDFDLPPYWDGNLLVYRSPTGTQSYDNALRQIGVNSQWYANYKYSVVDVEIEDAGVGYTSPPDVIFRGGDGKGVKGYATLNGRGGINRIIITNPGSGYTTPPSIVINGNGTNAKARALLQNVYAGNNTGHNLIRSIKTNVKFDRTTYTISNTFVFWSNISSVNVGTTLPAESVIVLNDTSMLQINRAYTIPANLALPVANVKSISTNEFSNANDRIASFSGNVNLSATQYGIERPNVTLEGNTFITDNFDTIVSSSFSSEFGVNPSEINVAGGEFYDTNVSYAPQELIPGRMYDTLNVTVFDTNNLSFRVFEDMNHKKNFYRIASANVTSLASTLSITDTKIQVADATKLPAPNKALAIPGVIFINGEKIVYYRNYALETPTPWAGNLIVPNETLISYSGNIYLTTGNVYSRYFANIASNVTTVNLNTLSQIRRSVDGTGFKSNLYPAGTRVVDSSAQQQIPGTAISNTTLNYNTEFVVTNYVSYGLVLNAPITANIGEIVTQYDRSGANITLTMRMLESVKNSKILPVILLNGTVANLPEVFDGPNGFDVEGFDTTTGTIRVNGVDTGAYIFSTYTLGNFRGSPRYPNGQMLDGAGRAQLNSGTTLETTKIWYSPAFGKPSNGYGLNNSTTDQARFLKAGLGYTP